MHESIETYTEDLKSRLKGRVDERALDELLLEVRSHYYAAVELYEQETDAPARALEMLGTSADVAARYRRENHRGGRAGVLLALAIAGIFYLQPVVYVVNDRITYLLSQPLAWINVAVFFVIACAWAKKMLIMPLTVLVLAMAAGTAIWLTPGHVWIPDPYAERPGAYAMVTTREAHSADRAMQHQRTVVRQRIAGILQNHRIGYTTARSPADLPEALQMGGKFASTAMFNPSKTPKSVFTHDFAAARKEWENVESIFPAIEAHHAMEDKAHQDLRRILAKGPWGSWFPMATFTFSWGGGVLLVLSALNGIGLILRKLLDRVGPIRRGVA